jgi:hypothetical protein
MHPKTSPQHCRVCSLQSKDRFFERKVCKAINILLEITTNNFDAGIR